MYVGIKCLSSAWGIEKCTAKFGVEKKQSAKAGTMNRVFQYLAIGLDNVLVASEEKDSCTGSYH